LPNPPDFQGVVSQAPNPGINGEILRP